MTQKKSGERASGKTSQKTGGTKKSAASKGRSRRSTITFRTAFEASPEFAQFGSNALSMFALSHYLRIEDLEEFAAGANVEGANDKKLDIFHLSISDGVAVLAQSYLSPNWNRPAAPANKAGDLNTAMAWLLAADENQVPPHLQSKAMELRKAIVNGEIKRIELLYIHNCFESVNPEKELTVVANATRNMVAALRNEAASSITVAHHELGLRTIEDLYKSRDSDILVDNLITLPIGRFVEEKGKGWRAILTTVPGDWLQDLYTKHGNRLFSANYRDYLGSTSHKSNINRAITTTAEAESGNFWVYNNGITALTNELKLGKSKKVRGISIINGAQTTGSVSDAVEEAAKSTRVLARIVECSSKELISNIIKYNNTQNVIKPADTRSNDMIQKRLKEEFGDKYNISYVHRRTDTRRPQSAITCASIGAPLCAFHGDPQTSFRTANDIFNDDRLYQQVFPQRITAEHIFLVRSLSIAIDKVRSEVKAKISGGTATDIDLQLFEVLKYAASKHFLLYIIGELADQIMDKRVADKYHWKSKPNVITAENVSLTNAWIEVLNTLLPQISMLIKQEEQEGEDASYEIPRSFERSKKIADKMKALVTSLKTILSPQFEQLRSRTST